MATVIVASGSAASRLPAQSCGQTSTGSCTVNVTLRAPIPFAAQISASASTTDIGQLTTADLIPGQATGAKEFTGPVITAQANFAWTLTIRAASASWTYSGTGSPSKPASDLGWRLGTSGSYAAMTTSGATLISGALGESRSTPIYFRTTWRWTSEPPGSYELPLTLTLAAP